MLVREVSSDKSNLDDVLSGGAVVVSQAGIAAIPNRRKGSEVSLSEGEHFMTSPALLGRRASYAKARNIEGSGHFFKQPIRCSRASKVAVKLQNHSTYVAQRPRNNHCPRDIMLSEEPLILVVLVAVLAAGCGDGDGETPTQPDQPSVAAVEVTPSSARLTALGDTQEFDATALDGGGDTISGVEINWSVTPDGVASVTSDGTVIAEGNGDAELKAEAAGEAGTGSVTVAQEPSRVRIKPDSVKFDALGDTAVFSAEVSDRNGNPISQYNLSWASSDTSVATVDSTGLVTAKKDGTASVSAQSSGIADTAQALVQLSARVILDSTSLRLQASGSGTALTVEARNENGELVTDNPSDFKWRSANDNLATVDGSGTVTPKAAGQVAITAEWNGLTDHLLINVIDASPQRITQWGTLRPTQKRLSGVWSTGSEAVWAVGENVALHYNGAGWEVRERFASVNVNGIWASGPDTVWAIGSNTDAAGGRILHYDGSQWSTEFNSNRSLYGIHGASPDDVWAVGDNGNVLRYDGTSWALASSDLTVHRLSDVWSDDSEAVWAVGGEGVIVHFDGTEWTQDSTPVQENLTGVWGTDSANVWAVGGRRAAAENIVLHYDGDGWTQVSPFQGSGFENIWGLQSGEMWAVGDPILHYNGTSFIEEAKPTNQVLTDVHATSDANVWSVGYRGEILHNEGGRWTPAVGAPTRGNISDIWGAAPDDVWASVTGRSAGRAILHYDGAEWNRISSPSQNLFGVWGSGPDDVWFVGAFGPLMHFNGLTVEKMTNPVNTRLLDVWGSGPNDIWAAGWQGKLIHYDGDSWRQVESPTTEAIWAIWGSGPENVWAAVNGGPFLRYDGHSWQQVAGASNTTIVSIWGSSQDDVWAVAVDGTILHYGGVEWKSVNSPTTGALWAVWGNGPDEAWAAGDQGTVLHYDGTAWQEAIVPSEVSFSTIWGMGTGVVWAGGDTGSLLEGER